MKKVITASSDPHKEAILEAYMKVKQAYNILDELYESYPELADLVNSAAEFRTQLKGVALNWGRGDT